MADGKTDKKSLTALLVAVATMLLTQVPKLVEMLDSKPSAEEVQEMIAEQTSKLTDAINDVVAAVKELEEKQNKMAVIEAKLENAQLSVASLEGSVKALMARAGIEPTPVDGDGVPDMPDAGPPDEGEPTALQKLAPLPAFKVP